MVFAPVETFTAEVEFDMLDAVFVRERPRGDDEALDSRVIDLQRHFIPVVHEDAIDLKSTCQCEERWPTDCGLMTVLAIHVTHHSFWIDKERYSLKK